MTLYEFTVRDSLGLDYSEILESARRVADEQAEFEWAMDSRWAPYWVVVRKPGSPDDADEGGVSYAFAVEGDYLD